MSFVMCYSILLKSDLYIFTISRILTDRYENMKTETENLEIDTQVQTKGLLRLRHGLM